MIEKKELSSTEKSKSASVSAPGAQNKKMNLLEALCKAVALVARLMARLYGSQLTLRTLSIDAKK